MLPSLRRAASASAATPSKYTTKGQAVGDSADLRRIMALPRRSRPSPEELASIAEGFKRELGIVRAAGTCECQSRFKRGCCDSLLPTQAWALHEARAVGGLLGPIGVGHGKTLLDLLVSLVVGAKTAVLFLPSNLKPQMLEADWHYYGQHWKLPNLAGGRFMTPGRPFLHVVSFSELSGAKSTDLLAKIRPDTIIVDEAHSLRNKTAARTKRFLRYFKDFPDTRLFAWSGTLTSRSLKDYAHLAAYSLRSGSPAPLAFPTVEEWSAHLDPGDFRAPAGKLLLLGDNGGTDARDIYRTRMVSTAGVVSSGDTASCQASLVISERKLEAPTVVKEHIKLLEETWQRPDGEELVDALSKARCARELSCGFYYRWRWPRGEPVPVIEAWLEARKEWHKELRERLKGGGVHMDSPLLVTKAAIRWEMGFKHTDEQGVTHEYPPHTKNGPYPTWDSEHWARWRELRDTARPETEAIWLDDFMVLDALEWLRESPGLLWYEFAALAERLVSAAREAGVPVTYAGPGDVGNQAFLGLTGAESVIASIRAHGTGKNAQAFHRNLVANPPSDGGAWEQMMGRSHRKGQMADEVTVEVYRHTASFKAAVERARDLSGYIEGTFGATQRLTSVATWRF